MLCDRPVFAQFIPPQTEPREEEDLPHNDNGSLIVPGHGLYSGDPEGPRHLPGGGRSPQRRLVSSGSLHGPSTDARHAGVTFVQYREKKADTGEQIRTAKKLHQITRRYNVPLVINDRVDVALAAGVEGVHLGQDDMGMIALFRNIFFSIFYFS